jgi:hypothetical protein
MVFREPGPILEKVFQKWRRNGKRPGGKPGRRPEIVVKNYASITATISCVRGLIITICSPTRM